MAITIGGSASANPADGSSRVTGNFGTVPTAGSTIAVGIIWQPDATHTVSSVTDSAGNTYVAAGALVHQAAGPKRAQIWYAKNVSTATPFAVTVTMSGSCFAIGVSAVEFKDTNTTEPKDIYNGQAQTNPGTGSNAVSTGNIGTPSTDGQAVFAVSSSNQLVGYTTGTGYTQRHLLQTGGITNGHTESLIQTTAAAVTATWTQDSASADFANAAITLKPAAAASAVPVFMNLYRQQRG